LAESVVVTRVFRKMRCRIGCRHSPARPRHSAICYAERNKEAAMVEPGTYAGTLLTVREAAVEMGYTYRSMRKKLSALPLRRFVDPRDRRRSLVLREEVQAALGRTGKPRPHHGAVAQFVRWEPTEPDDGDLLVLRRPRGRPSTPPARWETWR
jgi:hypothetical protein